MEGCDNAKVKQTLVITFSASCCRVFFMSVLNWKRELTVVEQADRHRNLPVLKLKAATFVILFLPINYTFVATLMLLDHIYVKDQTQLHWFAFSHREEELLSLLLATSFDFFLSLTKCLPI